jgi:acetamidase/formamidase
MDAGIERIWAGIPEPTRTPGVHIMTGPIHVNGARPGDTLRVDILEMRPRLPYGSNCAANWGLFYERFGKERITIYELVDPPASGFPGTARPMFGFDFTTLRLYDVPGVITPPDQAARQAFGRPVEVPVRPHLGVMGVAPAGSERLSSIPPGVFGGNVDNWRFGPGASVHYPVFHDGALFYVGDPHFSQGDGEICGTAIEASLDVRLRLSLADDVSANAPLLRTDTHWFTHGFGDRLDEAMAMAADQMLQLLVDRGGFTPDEAYSLASVAVDLGVTQVVDGTVGCHAAVAHDLLGAPS